MLDLAADGGAVFVPDRLMATELLGRASVPR